MNADKRRYVKHYICRRNDMKKNVGIAIVILALLMTSGIPGEAAPFNPGGWQYYREITVTNSGGALTDYQVLVQLSGSSFPTTTSNGADIRFTDASGNELSYWIESWDYAGKSASIWVKVPSIAVGATTMRMYYGNPTASASSSVTGTFIKEIGGVVGSWHFDEDAKDSSGNGIDGTIYGGGFANGKFGKALALNEG